MAKKKVLGRGLSALIGKTVSQAIVETEKEVAKDVHGGGERPAATEGEKVASAPPSAPHKEAPLTGYFLCRVGEISPGKYQPRKHFDETSLQELSNSIKEKGVIEPLIVMKAGEGAGHGLGSGGTYELIAGERRLRAAKMAGLSEVPVILVDVSDLESLEIALIENVQREDLNPIEEAEAYHALMDFGHTQEEVAAKVGRERATVANYLRLLRLPPEVKAEVAGGALSMGHARAILSLEGAAKQRALAKKVLKKGLSVRETEALAAKTRDKVAVGSVKSATDKGLEIKVLEDALRRIFSTKVLVKDKKGKGRIELLYYSSEERERLLDLLKTVG